MKLTRRGFIFGATVTSFAIVRPEILMPIKAFDLEPEALFLPPGAYDVVIDGVSWEAKTGAQIIMDIRLMIDHIKSVHIPERFSLGIRL